MAISDRLSGKIASETRSYGRGERRTHGVCLLLLSVGNRSSLLPIGKRLLCRGRGVIFYLTGIDFAGEAIVIPIQSWFVGSHKGKKYPSKTVEFIALSLSVIDRFWWVSFPFIDRFWRVSNGYYDPHVAAVLFITGKKANRSTANATPSTAPAAASTELPKKPVMLTS